MGKQYKLNSSRKQISDTKNEYNIIRRGP